MMLRVLTNHTRLTISHTKSSNRESVIDVLVVIHPSNLHEIIAAIHREVIVNIQISIQVLVTAVLALYPVVMVIIISLHSENLRPYL